jgi:hypothetical protein
MVSLVTSPVFAKSKPAAPQNEISAFSRSALKAHASAPGANPAANQNSPAATGGGSLGYNEMLRIY